MTVLVDKAGVQDCSVVDPPLPPLQLTARSKSGSLRQIPGLLGAAILVGLAARALGAFSGHNVFAPAPLDTADRWAACLLALFASVAWHEAGHLLAALILRFHVSGLSLGPFRLTRLHGGWNLQAEWRRFFRGSITAVPRDTVHWRSRTAIVAAAGPLATAIFGLCSVLICGRRASGYGNGFFHFSAQINLLLFLLGLLPTPVSAAEPNDMRLFLASLRFDQQARHVLLYHLALNLKREGRRPRDYPDWLIRALAAARPHNAMQAAFALWVADWALDKGDLISAAAWNTRVAQAAEACPVRFCYSLLAHAACLDLIVRGDLLSAGEKMRRVSSNSLIPKAFHYRSQAVWDIACCRPASARANLQRARFYRPATPIDCFAYEDMLLAALSRMASDTSGHAA